MINANICGVFRCSKKVEKHWRDTSCAGPVLSRFDRFLLIGPRAQGVPALRLQPTQTYNFCGSCLFIALARSPVFFKLFCETEIIIKFSQVSQSTVYTRFTTTIKIHQNLDLQTSRYSDEIVLVSENVFALSKVKT